VDGHRGARSDKDVIAENELFLAVRIVFAVVCWDQGFGGIFTGEASASGGVAWIEDNGGDFIYTSRGDYLASARDREDLLGTD
jgi:hypothetical protein